jgi:hypothetical protein
MRFCEKESSTYLKSLHDGPVKTSELTALEEDPRIQYRYMFRNGLEIVNPVVDEAISIQPGMVVSLYGVKSPQRK